MKKVTISLTETTQKLYHLLMRVWGIDFVKKLNGMFAIAIYDKFNKKFFLIRDRVGIKPLFYLIIIPQYFFPLR